MEKIVFYDFVAAFFKKQINFLSFFTDIAILPICRITFQHFSRILEYFIKTGSSAILSILKLSKMNR